MTGFVHVKGLRELDRVLQEVPIKLERNVLRGALRAGAGPIRDAARANIHHVSGELAKSLKIGTRARGGVVTASVRTRLFYAPFVEFGTQPHEIRPKNRAALAVGGLFLESVQHPGARPHPFLRPAMDSQATAAVLAAGEYIRARLTKEGLDTAHMNLEADE